MQITPLIQKVILTLSILGAKLEAQTLLNGSFEVGTDPNTGSGLNIGMTAPDSVTIPGWTVAFGTVDYIGGRWAAGDGSRSLDLSGVSAGTILQNVAGFTPGVAYEVSFLMSANPEGGSATKSLEVSIGNTSQVFSFNRESAVSDMGWVQHSLVFTATEPAMSLTFASLNGDASGPALDGVRIQAIPEPSIWALIAVGAGTFAASRRRQHDR